MDNIQRAQAISREYDRWRPADDETNPLPEKQSVAIQAELEIAETSEDVERLTAEIEAALAVEAEQEEAASFAREERWETHRQAFIEAL